MSKFSEWTKENKIRFNEQKSKVMLMTRRKRKERKELELNDKPLLQVHSLKYLGVIFDSKLTFGEHINYMAKKCTKLIFDLSKSAKLNWGLKHKALKTIYTGGILPLLLYEAPVWKKAIDKVSYKSKLVRVQTLMNLRTAKAYSTILNEALCIITGLIHIAIKIEEAFQFYQFTRGRKQDEDLVDFDMELKYWHHPAETINCFREDTDETTTIQIFIDGSKSEHEVGAGVSISKSGDHIASLKYRINKRCINSQAEKLPI